MYKTYEVIVQLLKVSSVPFTIHEHTPSYTVADAEAVPQGLEVADQERLAGDFKQDLGGVDGSRVGPHPLAGRGEDAESDGGLGHGVWRRTRAMPTSPTTWRLAARTLSRESAGVCQ